MASAATRQAKNEAVVRYGPQRFALQQLIQQAITARDLALHAAVGAEQGIRSALGTAHTETVQNYGDALHAAAGTDATVHDALSGLGATADPFRAMIAREGGVGANRMTESRTNALQDLTNRRLEAASGRAFATQHATDQFNTDIGKVQQSYQELASEQGAFTQGRVGELRKEAADRAFQRDLAQQRDATTRRGQTLASQDRNKSLTERTRHDQQTEKTAAAKQRAAAKNQLPGGVKLRTADAHQSLWDNAQQALIDAKGLKPHAKSYQQVLDVLNHGVPAVVEKDAQGNSVHKPGLKAHGRLSSILAADLAFYNGAISENTMRILHRNGYSTKRLNVKVIHSSIPAATPGPHGHTG